MGNKVARESDLIPTYESIKVEDRNAVSISIKGVRETMEDTSIMCKLSLPGYYLFAVFDGHGGYETAEYLRSNFLDFFQNHQLWKEYVMKLSSDLDLNEITLSRQNSDATEIVEGAETLREWTELFTNIFIEFDQMLYNRDKGLCFISGSGSTAVIVILTPDSYICVSLGDSEASIIDEESYKLSVNHKPNDYEEHRRITNSGLFVSMSRVNGDLALSRAFGDFKFKKLDQPNIDPRDYAVIVIPTVKIFTRKSDDKYLILACDGLWDVVTDKLKIGNFLITDIKNINQIRQSELKQKFEKKWLSKQRYKDFGTIDGICSNINPTDNIGNPMYIIPEYVELELESLDGLELIKWQVKNMINIAIRERTQDNVTIILVKL